MHYVTLAKQRLLARRAKRRASFVQYGLHPKPKHPNYLKNAVAVIYGKHKKPRPPLGLNATRLVMAPTQRAKAVPGVPSYGYTPDSPDERDLPYEVGDMTPRFVDLCKDSEGNRNPAMPPVWDQGDLGSCTAHGSLAAHLFAAYQSGVALPMLSRLEVYYNARSYEGTTATDSGAQVRDAIKACAQGVAPETDWMYDVSRFAQPPYTRWREDSTNHAIEYRTVGRWPGPLQSCLNDGFPVVVGLTLYESFESQESLSSGVVPYPQWGERALGGHCMLVVGIGYGREWVADGQFPAAAPDVRYVKLRNSWGTDVYQGGYLLMPAAYLHRHGADFWTIRSAN